MTDFVVINDMVHAVACRRCRSGDAFNYGVWSTECGSYVPILFCFDCNMMLCEPCFNKRHISCSKGNYVDIENIKDAKNFHENPWL